MWVKRHELEEKVASEQEARDSKRFFKPTPTLVKVPKKADKFGSVGKRDSKNAVQYSHENGDDVWDEAKQMWVPAYYDG